MALACLLPLIAVERVRKLPVWLVCASLGGGALLEALAGGAPTRAAQSAVPDCCDCGRRCHPASASAIDLRVEFLVAHNLLASGAAGAPDYALLALFDGRPCLAEAFLVPSFVSHRGSALAWIIREYIGRASCRERV